MRQYSLGRLHPVAAHQRALFFRRGRVRPGPQLIQFGEVSVHRGRVQDQQSRGHVAAVAKGMSRATRHEQEVLSLAKELDAVHTKVTDPSRTKNASEQSTCRCGSGRRPRGGRVRSISEKSPPVCSAPALKAMTLPRALRILPWPAGMTLGSVIISRFR